MTTQSDVPVLDHGVIGNGRVLALVSPTSSIEWLCLPRFDSPSIFGSLLDSEHGGHFRIVGRNGPQKGNLRYVTNTNVLVSDHTDGENAWQVIDFAPRVPRGLSVDAPIEIVRIVRPLRGAPRIRIELKPRPDYGRAPTRLVPTGRGISIEGANVPITLHTNAAPDHLDGNVEVTLQRTLWFVMSVGSRHAPTEGEVLSMHDDTVRGWQMWARTCALPTFAPAPVLRSALCLKLHAYIDTGAIIAAATTSVPEAMGTPRTWDYRFCWLRDAAFVVEALRRLSHLGEGEQFLSFLRNVAEGGELQPLYGICGEREVPEIMLPHLAGFGGNGFVRAGNAAALQQQNDLNGELILCLQTILHDPRVVIDQPTEYLPLVERLVEDAIRRAPLPDTSIWEFRSLMREYVFSRAMCWAAIDRGAMIAGQLGRSDLADRWAAAARSEQEIVLRRGYNAEVGMFTQTLDGHMPDASNLLLPSLGLLDARDARFQSTLKMYDDKLARNGLLLRYTNDDDFGETTSAFTLCSFWWAEALALSGRLDDAIAVFERVCRYANPLGLFSEDIEPSSGRLLGNFPQAYTHVGLVHAAMTISELLEVRDGRVRAWT
ncbi:MAG TPA: glycoside hydrolase family 15 protein [Kofleriaceae bacterium]|nr:glycoside hydrolase family 15 protein [Kofleriaceae bacterium]